MEAVHAYADLYHPAGPRIRMPFPPPEGQPDFYIKAFTALSDALEAGWLSTAPGLNEGEARETVGYVVKGEQEKNGKATPYLLLYSDQEGLNNYSFLKRYLDRPEDIAAFEHASGMKLANIPTYIGDNKPERGKSSKIDREFIIPAPKPFQVVYKPNPKYSEAAAAEAKKTNAKYVVPARVFVRWVDQLPGASKDPADRGGLPPQAPTGDAMQAEMQRVGWKWAQVVAGINSNFRTNYPGNAKYNTIASKHLAGVFEHLKTLPTAPKLPKADTPRHADHIERIRNCQSSEELSMAEKLLDRDAFIPDCDRPDFANLIRSKREELNGGIPTEAQNAAFTGFLSDLAGVENNVQLDDLDTFIRGDYEARKLHPSQFRELAEQIRKIRAAWERNAKR